MRRFWYRLRFALELTSLDLEDINYMCDYFIENQVSSADWSERLHRIHDLAVEANRA